MDLSLVLTLYNEGSILTQSLENIYKMLKKQSLDFEIIFVDDKSQDNSLARARDFIQDKDNCSIIRHEINIGRGGSVSDGIKKARGEVVGFIDTDLEISPVKIPEAVRMILNHETDVVTGLRIYPFDLAFLGRLILTKGYHLLIRIILRIPLKDTETGFKFFNRIKILPVLETVSDKRWFWDTEIMARSYYAHLKIKEIPVLYKRRPNKKSTVKIFRDTLHYFIKLLRFSLKRK